MNAPVDGGSARSPRVHLVTFVVVAALVVAGVAAAVAASRPDDPLAEAIAIARPADDYGTGVEAGRTLARVASALNRGIRACDREAEPDQCAALGAASGYVQVAAATVVRCTAPGRLEAQQAVVELLEDVRHRRPGDPPVRTPELPRCR